MVAAASCRRRRYHHFRRGKRTLLQGGRFFSKEFKEDVSLRLLCLESPDSKSSWPNFFVQLFDRIFSKKPKPGGESLPEWRKHLSWHCFWRSSVASGLGILLLLLIAVTSDISVLPENDWGVVFGWAFLISVFLNLLPDYISLLETRYLLR